MRLNTWRQGVVSFFIFAVLAIPENAVSESTKFLSYYLYDDFRRHPASEIYKGAPVPVVAGSDPQANHFRTRLREGAKSGPNFAGIYTVVEWGCGTNCQQVAVVNARTGRVSDWLTTELGSNYRFDSMLFIKNPDTGECSVLEWCRTEYYLFKNGKFVLLK